MAYRTPGLRLTDDEYADLLDFVTAIAVRAAMIGFVLGFGACIAFLLFLGRLG